MTQHTPEPWRVCEPPNNDMITCDAVSGRYLVYCTRAGGQDGICKISEQEQEANARRIVACVNACAGISTDTLIEYGDGNLEALFKMQQQRDELQAKCDELLAAMHKAIFDLRTHGAVIRMLREAIAKARGQQL